jgi:hypothetical protein
MRIDEFIEFAHKSSFGCSPGYPYLNPPMYSSYSIVSIQRYTQRLKSGDRGSVRIAAYPGS